MKVENANFMCELLKTAASYSIPLFWGVKNNGQSVVANNGTAFILNTGKRTFVVTAAHVYEAYIKSINSGEGEKSQLANIEFDLSERLISCIGSSIIDIATFEITPQEISTLGKSVLFGSNSVWPPSKCFEGQAIVIAGFPGLERMQIVNKSYSFGAHCFNTPASSVSERHFGCSLDRKHWIDLFGKGFPEKNFDLGGISGAPALALEESTQGIISWRLAGIVYEANASELMGEIVFSYHTKFIGELGAILSNA